MLRASVCHPAAFLVLAAAVVALSAGEPLQPGKPDKDTSGKAVGPQTVLARDTVVKSDLPYGKDEKQRLDLYAPKGIKQAPVVVFVHGGEWTKGNKTPVGFKPKLLNENGIVFVSINYRLTPVVKHPAHVRDVAAAVRWLYDHVAEHGGDPRKMVLMGHSAGCHLVTLVSLDLRYLAEVKLTPADLRGVVAWSGGAYDLVEKVKSGGRYGEFIKNTFGDSEVAWKDASPVSHVKDGRALPAYLFVSVEAGNASHKAAERLAGLIRAARGQATSRLLEGRTHRTANELLGSPDDATAAILLDFLRNATR